MGLNGWDLIYQSATLAGTLQSQHYSGGGGLLSTNDYDSNLEVVPGEHYTFMLQNRGGFQNPGGVIECEIHVARDVPDTPNLDWIFNPCVGKQVYITGPFVEDKSHDNKTEIHPIDSMWADMGTDGVRHRLRLCVFSDDWGWIASQPQEPFFARTDRIGNFVIEFPPFGGGGLLPLSYVPTYIANVAQISGYQSAQLAVLLDTEFNRPYFYATVHSGTPDNHQGLYVADVTLYWRPPRNSFQALDPDNILVLGSDGNLWLEHAPFGQVPPRRDQIDRNVLAFQGIDISTVFVLDVNGDLWWEVPPLGMPHPRLQVDGNVLAFQALAADTVFVLGTDGNLWREHFPWGVVPPQREQVDGNVLAFQALDADTVLVLGFDGNLWLEHAPFGNVPPQREQVDGNVLAFQSYGDRTDIVVLGADGNLWQELPPFGHVPPRRHQIDGNVQAFQILAAEGFAWVLGTDGKLWLEEGPFGTVPPPRQLIDANVQAFQPLDLSAIVVLGTDGNLWLEHAPFGNPPPPREQIDANVRLTEPIGLVAQVSG